ncbi:Shedu immune nuclease family protein [Nocardia seriolae]|uniref:Shedu protein SduA C-terminal domain-containing protein n=2 Tax=Nocardia seriolae TaxID=37332 RepID=A0ABC9Z7D7_9NOCA|nr:Shedu immune nuclease family protein [Nocardia seriolae]QUN15339.1 DUF4263 domain-containing protein [Nocardia seriolae]WKY51013.1 DUF4263 domain-containing protein [Nocardia seriolae]BAW05073.1 conserved hypothetical protein [Nocardia seriolae]BEK90310.1 hypothetical protein NSERKGN1266_62610 [Nocardia seriolae]BEK93862.1 hypothetical protein NSER024013_17680 [Nocardia seriolae]
MVHPLFDELRSKAMANPIFDELLMSSTDKEFDVEGGDFSQLEIRQSQEHSSFHYFYDKQARRLVVDFVLNDGARVATICSVTLVRVDDQYTPRLKFWKKDKTKPGKAALELPLPDLPEYRMIKALVDTDSGHRNFWKLVNYLQACTEISLPSDQFHLVAENSTRLVEMLEGSDKDMLVAAMAKLIGGTVTQADLDLIAGRKGQLDYFQDLLMEKSFFEEERRRRSKKPTPLKPESLWQAFFEENQWVFGYGLNLVACESYDPAKLELPTTGANAFDGAGKRVDALLRTRGQLSSLMFCEIKRHDTPLLDPKPYRIPDVYRPSEELSGAVCQVQKTADKAIRAIRDHLYAAYNRDGAPAGFDVATIRPRQVVVAGMASQFEEDNGLNREKVSSFELYRRSVSDVEVITFDELLARARFIVADD